MKKINHQNIIPSKFVDFDIIEDFEEFCDEYHRTIEQLISKIRFGYRILQVEIMCGNWTSDLENDMNSGERKFKGFEDQDVVEMFMEAVHSSQNIKLQKIDKIKK